METLELRAQMLAAARRFFSDRRVMEVETPALVQYGVTDVHLQNLRCISSALPATAGYLHTSPEYHMKRLLAAGAPDIYQICKVFRDAERGRRHHPEFSMIEWYRLGFTLEQMIAETCALIETLAAIAGNAPGETEQLSYRDAFLRATGLDPLSATVTELAGLAKQKLSGQLDETLLRQLGDDPAALQDLLMSHLVIPGLNRTGLVVIHRYPAAQAALARIDPADQRVAERFEVFHAGLELANGYHELSDPAEQRRRFTADRQHRKKAGLPAADPDPALLAALDHGLPDCSGVAIGFDRILMSFKDFSSIEKTMSFTE